MEVHLNTVQTPEIKFNATCSKKNLIIISNNKIYLLISSQFRYSLGFSFEKYYVCLNGDRGFRLMFCEIEKS